MKLSPAGLHLIASFEGYVPRPYNDSAGNATIGYGHLIHMGLVTSADVSEWAHATPASLLALLNGDAQTAVEAVNEAVKVRLGVLPQHAQARFDALCSLTFNIGSGAFATSSLLSEINRQAAPRSWTTCGPLWIEWDHAGGFISEGLLSRRRAEFGIFNAGRYPR